MKGLDTTTWRKYNLVLVIGIQVILCIVGFNKVLFQDGKHLFKNDQDGGKNYYYYYAYVTQPEKAGYTTMALTNYPYAESIYYLDNTPVFAVAMRWVHLNICDLTTAAIPLYHYYLVLGVVLCSIFLMLIFHQLNIRGFIATIGALTLPWLNPQIFRMPIGHYNLSFSWFFLAGILLVFLLSKELFSETRKFRLALIAIALFFLQLFAAFNHLYYIPLVGLTVCGTACLYFLFRYKQWRRGLVGALMVAGSTALAALVSLQIIYATDIYMDGRTLRQAGFAYFMWNLSFPYLFSSYPDNTFQFIVGAPIDIGRFESFTFLGNGALYSLLFLLVGIIARWIYQGVAFPVLLAKENGRFIWALVITGIVGIIISLGEWVDIFGHVFRNQLNPFLQLQDIYPPVTQFRALARFAWIIFWGVNIGTIWLICHSRTGYKKFMVVVWLFFTLVDTTDRIAYMNSIHVPNHFSVTEQHRVSAISDNFNLSQYDALLPMPYFHVGAASGQYTLEPNEDWMRHIFSCSATWQMPLMAHKGNRCREEQAIALTAMFRGEAIPGQLMEKLKGKKVLIYRSNSLEPDICRTLKEGPALDILHDMTIIGQTSHGTLYSWEP